MTQQDDVTFPHSTGTAVRTLPEAFQLTASVRPSAVALRTPGSIQEVTWREYGERVKAIAAGLAGLGIGHGDTVGIMLTNRPEFHLVDTAALHLGAIPFSIYNTSSPEQIEYLFGNAENRVVVTEKAFLDKVRQSGASLEHIIVVDGPANDAATLEDVEASPAADFDFDAAWRAVAPTDVATLIYTSGTTGPPKGVEITHRNMIAQLVGVEHVLDVGFDDRVASYLPAAHIADRVSAHAMNMVRGIQITSVADPREIAAALPDTRPTVFFGVPRVWQKIKAGIEAKLAEEPSPIKRNLANWAIGVGLAAAQKDLAGEGRGLPLTIQHTIADALVLSKLRHALGLEQIKFAGSGAAAIPAEVLQYFLGLGIAVLEVWGLSETTGVSTTTTHDDLKIGTVGKAVNGVELKLAEDGELLVRGAVVMRGYRKQPEKTAETIDADGWLVTGDIATVDAEGNVSIVDRKKELIISEAGKNMSPTNIENAMKASSSLISQAVAIGEARPYITALIALDPDAAAVRAKALGIPGADLATLTAREELRKEVAEAIRAGNKKLSQVEQIKRFVISSHYWEPGGEELTPTMKLRRKPISAMYADEIIDLYAAVPGNEVVDLR
ncbi:AMP-dependent synthetase/ligase [Antrihabitans cavernicola]|uniref:Acyl-CoA synthetase n=1 Tax=Antrihabitans cavernicola TaxID=2495913 RepID=A0A5A7SCJ6_9NOCA|nr:long-chain fatty acid--CoA ligase [Spelaeibacter cavernicola]KAA0023616.1 long-chain fatty acid--CoA ligase [Spelaeibacter cavernicola]